MELVEQLLRGRVPIVNWLGWPIASPSFFLCLSELKFNIIF